MFLLTVVAEGRLPAQSVQTICSFNFTNGAFPQAALTLGTDGNFYGTTSQGGSNKQYDYGTVFKVTTNGTLTSLVSFNSTNGVLPSALTLGTDGNFYGITSEGGSSNCGTVFKVTTNGTLTTLASFSGTNGAFPQAALTLGTDGNFYGTTEIGGNSGYGTAFKVTTNGTLTSLVSFNFTNEALPSALTLGTDGNFYGTTEIGGITNSGCPTIYWVFAGGTTGVTVITNFNSMGTVFKVTTNGTLTTLVSFNLTNGAWPTTLTLGTDGNFYGTTETGGITNSTYSSGMGTVFKVTTNGTLTSLVSFNFTNGILPQAALTLGAGGNFYGTTARGGITNSSNSFGMGTLFKVAANGALTSLFFSTPLTEPFRRPR